MFDFLAAYCYSKEVGGVLAPIRVTIADDEVRFLFAGEKECIVRHPGRIEITDRKIEIETAECVVWRRYAEREARVPENLLVTEYRMVGKDRLRISITGYFESETEGEIKNAKPSFVAFARSEKKPDRISLEEAKYLFFLYDGSRFGLDRDTGYPTAKVPRKLEEEWEEELKRRPGNE